MCEFERLVCVTMIITVLLVLCAHASNYLVADWLKVEKKVERRNFKNRSKGYAKYIRAHVEYKAHSYDAKIASQLGFLYL